MVAPVLPPVPYTWTHGEQGWPSEGASSMVQLARMPLGPCSPRLSNDSGKLVQQHASHGRASVSTFSVVSLFLKSLSSVQIEA